MKILIIGFTKIKYMPYLNFYLKNIDFTNHDVHILYWNRDCKDELLENDKYKYYQFRWYQEDDVRKIFKIKSFLKYRKFAKKILMKESFDKIIILHSLPAVLLYDIIKKRFKQKYIFDFRDITFEKNYLFRKIIHKICINSFATFVSSRGYLSYLPNNAKIYISHNLDENLLKNRDFNKKILSNNKIVSISFWGFIRHENINKALIDSVGNNPNFILNYYGRIQNVARNLQLYVNEKGYNNIYFKGEYSPKDRINFSKECVLIDNLYDDYNSRLAMGNKFYDGLIFYIPQICMPGTIMGKLCSEFGVGIELSPYENNFTDKVCDYLKNLNFEKFKENCDKLLSIILHEYENGKIEIKKFLKEKEELLNGNL